MSSSRCGLRWKRGTDQTPHVGSWTSTAPPSQTGSANRKPVPKSMVELHSRAAFLRAWKALDLPTDDGGPSHTSLVPPLMPRRTTDGFERWGIPVRDGRDRLVRSARTRRRQPVRRLAGARVTRTPSANCGSRGQGARATGVDRGARSQTSPSPALVAVRPRRIGGHHFQQPKPRTTRAMYETATSTVSPSSLGRNARPRSSRPARHELNKRRAASLQQHTPPMRARRRSKLEAEYLALDQEAKALALRHITDHGRPCGRLGPR